MVYPPSFQPGLNRNPKLPKDCWLSWPEIKLLVSIFHEESAEIRFVGGAVRDALLGRVVKDIDAATPISPQKAMSILEKAGVKVIPTGLSHGTITAIINNKHIEITTLRRDVKTYGRHADVLFTDSWEEDAKRRDFTMNALYCDPDGKIYDYVDGYNDALEGCVRFIGDANKRVQEDGLRILRFFRFSAHYGHAELDSTGLKACKQNWTLLENLSGERIQQEMFKLLMADRAPEMLEIMERADLTESLALNHIDIESLVNWPKVRLMADVKPNPLIPLALILRSQQDSLKVLKGLQARWKLSNEHCSTLQNLCSLESIEPELDEYGQKKAFRALGEPLYIKHVLISWTERLLNTPENAQLLAAAYRAMLALVERWEPPEFPITGDDLIACGMEPSPKLGECLKRLEQYWEDENFKPQKNDLLALLEVSH